MKYFNKTTGQERKKSTFFKLLIHILNLAKQISVPQTHELLTVTPIFTEALPTYSTTSNPILELLLDGLLGRVFFKIKIPTLELLKMAPIDKISDADLKIFIANFCLILTKEDQSLQVKMKTLDCLELLAKRAQKRVLPYQSYAVKGIAQTIGSTKRVVRQKAANVRNYWELLGCWYDINKDFTIYLLSFYMVYDHVDLFVPSRFHYLL